MNLDFTIADIAKITQGTLRGNSKAIVNAIFIDSRNHFSKKSLFIAINGDINDGHDYLVELYEKGVRNFIIERSSRKKLVDKARFFKRKTNTQFIDANIVVVENAITALQQIAAFHRKKFDIPVIGITGSNGKTIVKEWLFHFLRNQYNIVRSPKSYNSQVGVPLSVLQMAKEHTLAIFEAGISLPGEMEKLERIISPTHGILTNILTAHLSNFKDENELEEEKMKLFINCKVVFNGNSDFFNDVVTEKEGNCTKITTSCENGNLTFNIPFLNRIAVQNALTCAGFLLKFGISKENIVKKTETLPQIALRLETRKGKDGNIIIFDNYNSDINSLRIALDYLERYDKSKKRNLIFSDIRLDKGSSSDLYKEIAQLINERNIDNFIGIGIEILTHRALFDKGYFYENTQQYLNDFENNKFEKTIVLVKGASGFHFEKIVNLLEEKSHETVLEINLNAIRYNIKTYKNLLQPSTQLLVMVKAFGYGIGSKELGQVLQHNNINYLGVAYTDEGIDLRKSGIDLPILVMNAEKGSFDDVIEQNLEPAIFSFNQLDNFIRKLIDLGIKDYPIHIKIDSGMNRLGFVTQDIDNLISIISSQPEIRVKSIFSHLAGSDEKQHNDFTLRQISIFNYIAEKLEERIGYSTIKHILNSSGIEHYPEAQLDMVRLGIGMYGVSSSLKNLETVGTLKTVISQIKTIKKGDSVGYGRSQFATKDTAIAIIPIGYADGFSRALSNGKGHVLIKGELVPVFGKVCMDMTMIDISETSCKEGDIVEIFGSNRSIEELAKEMNTISYEVMTSISERVVRVYLEE